jgi:YVTN family beta-propeller protein
MRLVGCTALSLAVGMLAFGSARPGLAGPAPHYEVTKTVALGAPDRWDYVVFDPASGRVYVAHGDRVTVVNGRTGAIVGDVQGFPGGTHGIAIVGAYGRGYTDDGRAGEAGAFSLETLKVEKRIKAADDPDAITFDPVSGHVFVVNGDPGTLTVIDPRTDAAIATVEVGSQLEYAVAGGDGKLYVNGVAKREIFRVDTRTNQVDARWPIPGCVSPHGLAMDSARRRLFSSCENGELVVINADSGAVVTTVPIGSGTDAAAFDPRRELIFSSNGGDGTLSVIEERDPGTYVPIAAVKTALTARTMSLDPRTGRLYIVAADVDARALAAAQALAARGDRPRRHVSIVPGSLKLLFLDPEPGS